jgi:hypothetical protein
LRVSLRIIMPGLPGLIKPPAGRTAPARLNQNFIEYS